MIITRCPASCGELIQGLIAGSEKLISLPINLYSTVTLFEGKSDRTSFKKSYQVLERVFEFYGYDSRECKNLTLSINSGIPLGKGMASSTADIAATILAGARYLGKAISTEDIARLSTKVEPTDSVFFTNFTLFNHINASYHRSYDFMPEFKVLMLEGNEIINTIEFRKINRENILLENKEDLDKALSLFETGVNKKDLRMIGEAATISAFANQKILYKEHLEEIYDLSMKHNALGINVAHSGSVVGILYKEQNFDKDRFLYTLKEKKLLENYVNVADYDVISGGVEELEPSWGYSK